MIQFYRGEQTSIEPIIQSEVSQKEKCEYCIYMESRKMVLMNLFVGKQWRNRYREQTYGKEEGKERVRYMERVTWKLIYSHM